MESLPFVIQTEVGTIYVSAVDPQIKGGPVDYWGYFHALIARLIFEEYQERAARQGTERASVCDIQSVGMISTQRMK